MTSGQSAFTENDIRPAELMAAKERFVEADRDYLLARKSEWVKVACPACGSGDATPKWEKLGFVYERCPACDTLFTNPRPSQELLKDFYEQSQNYACWNREIFPATESVRRERIFRPRALHLQDYCSQLGVHAGTILEVGAGFGTFCEELRSLDIFERIIALEPTPDLAETCRDRGLEVIESTVEELDDIEVDVVAAFEVLEHLFAPLEFIKKCRSLLRPGGMLLLTCPSWKGFDVSTLKTLSNTVDHEHLNYFHPYSIRLLVANNGFSVKEVETPGTLDADIVRKHVLTGSVDVSDQPWLSHVLLEGWSEWGQSFQSFLAKNKMSSHMWMVAVKQ